MEGKIKKVNSKEGKFEPKYTNQLGKHFLSQFIYCPPPLLFFFFNKNLLLFGQIQVVSATPLKNLHSEGET